MRFKRTGKCKQCGECCKTLVSEWFMTGYNPVEDPRTTGCIYLEEQPNGRYNCLIKTGEVNFDSLSENVKEYYLRECLSFPDPKKQEHCPPIYRLPEKCGYRIVEVR